MIPHHLCEYVAGGCAVKPIGVTQQQLRMENLEFLLIFFFLFVVDGHGPIDGDSSRKNVFVKALYGSRNGTGRPSRKISRDGMGRDFLVP